MVHSAKSNNSEGWGMGFLLILFDNHSVEHPSFFRKRPSFSSSSKSNNLLLSKTQSILSICGLLVFTTLLLFTLSTFEPTSLIHHHSYPSRRFLHQNPKITQRNFWVTTLFSPKSRGSESNFPHALQGLGALYLRGTKATSHLIVGHLSDESSEKEVTTFLRLIFHSGLLSHSDLALIYPSPLLASKIGGLVKLECDSFLRLVQLSRKSAINGELRSELAQYLTPLGEGERDPPWGKSKKNNSSSELSELTPASYGSVVGFEAAELDPEDSLSGFLDRPPMALRRWAGYPMLLGRVRRKFNHVMLIDVRKLLVISDPFTLVGNRSSESVFLWSDSGLTRHRGKAVVNPGVIIGGTRGVRRFVNAALSEIVRAAIERKGRSRNSVTESGLVNQLVHNGHVLKNIDLVMPTESIPDSGSLDGFNPVDSGSRLLKLSDHFSVVQRGSSGDGSGSFDVDYAVIREICSSHKELYSSVYSDCLASQ